MEPHELSKPARLILEAIAEGHSFDQILAARLAASYHDIFKAAAEALEIAERVRPGKTYDERTAEIKQKHARAYQKWSAEEDAELTACWKSGSAAKEIGAKLQRQTSAIRSRLLKLGLVQHA